MSLTLEQKLAYLEEQLKQVEAMKKQVQSSMKNLAREKNKKPIVASIHEAQSSGKFSVKLERGAVKHYMQADFLEYILNHADDIRKLIDESNKLNSDLELSKTEEKKVA